MTPLITCDALSKSYAANSLFQELSLSLFDGEKIGLIGPNGSGKSTLLKILARLETQDEGTVSVRKGLKIGYVPQQALFPNLSPAEVLIEALKEEDLPSYEKERLAEVWLTRLVFPSHIPLAPLLSGGWKKRLSFAAQMIRSPDLLLLDEPTNHLDLEGILWLEKFLLKEAPTYLVVSHDRAFLERVTNRVVELNRAYPKGVFSIRGNYGEFLVKKREFLLGQLEQERALASKARRETEWLRQTPKARTTKSKSRIDEAGELFEQLSQVEGRNRDKRSQISFAATERETRKLLVAKNLMKKVGEKTLFQKLDLTLSPGSRIGLMGPNGSGKTTFLRLLAGEVEPDLGTIKRADDLKVVYFDQHRSALPDHITLKEALSPRGDHLLFRGESIHVNGWCKRFLFSPDILGMAIGKLSGGERARIGIAHLMLQPADLLLLDEPTNDLDIPTLEILEESLLEFPGAIVLITHDRSMLQRVATSIVSLGKGEVETFADYFQWERGAKESEAPPRAAPQAPPVAREKKGKLTYLERQEYEAIEGKIERLEREIRELTHELEKTQEGQKLSVLGREIGVKEAEVDLLYLRFAELDEKKNR